MQSNNYTGASIWERNMADNEETQVKKLDKRRQEFLQRINFKYIFFVRIYIFLQIQLKYCLVHRSLLFHIGTNI